MEDNQITPEIIESAVNNEELFPVISEAIAKKGFSLLDESGRNQLIDNYKKSDDFKKSIDEVTSNYHSYYDKDLKEVFGEDSDMIKPREGETKTYHVNKRILKEQRSKISELEDKIAKGGDHKDFYEGKLKEEEIRFQKTLQSVEKQLEEARNEVATSKKMSALQDVYAPIKSKIDPERIDDIFLEAEKAVQKNVLANSKMEDGTLVMLKEDGSVMKDDMFRPVTVAAYLEGKYSKVFKKDEPSGAGTNSSGSNKPLNPDGITVENFNPGDVKSKGDLIDALHNAGLESGTPKFSEIFAHWQKKMELK